MVKKRAERPQPPPPPEGGGEALVHKKMSARLCYLENVQNNLRNTGSAMHSQQMYTWTSPAQPITRDDHATTRPRSVRQSARLTPLVLRTMCCIGPPEPEPRRRCPRAVSDRCTALQNVDRTHLSCQPSVRQPASPAPPRLASPGRPLHCNGCARQGRQGSELTGRRAAAPDVP